MSFRSAAVRLGVLSCRSVVPTMSSICPVAPALFLSSIGLTMVARRSGGILVRTLTTSAETPATTGSTKRKKSSIYTRTGDQGKSSLYNGERKSKDDLVFHALGHQDELNAVLGISREHCLAAGNGLDEKIVEIQSRLFDLGAAIATPVNNSSEEKLQYTQFSSVHTEKLESWIDELDAQLPPLTNFILPSGGMSSTHLNLARTVCRRAERAVVPLVHDERADKEVARYLNRLSDFLFVAGRFSAMKEGRTETIWRKAQN